MERLTDALGGVDMSLAEGIIITVVLVVLVVLAIAFGNDDEHKNPPMYGR